MEPLVEPQKYCEVAFGPPGADAREKQRYRSLNSLVFAPKSLRRYSAAVLSAKFICVLPLKSAAQAAMDLSSLPEDFLREAVRLIHHSKSLLPLQSSCTTKL